MFGMTGSKIDAVKNAPENIRIKIFAEKYGRLKNYSYFCHVFETRLLMISKQTGQTYELYIRSTCVATQYGISPLAKGAGHHRDDGCCLPQNPA
jgi:hypothetical protein